MTVPKKLSSLSDGQVRLVTVRRREEGGPRYIVSTADEERGLTADVRPAVDGLWSVLVGHSSYEARVERENGEIVVEISGERFRFASAEGLSPGTARDGASGRVEVKAPMPGKVVQWLVAPGARVRSGEGVLLFEAMKMQNEIRSPKEGTLADIAVEEGRTVEARDRLFTVEPF